MADQKDRKNTQKLTYYLPLTQLRLVCKVTETPKLTDGNIQYDLRVSDLSIAPERIADTSTPYFLEVDKGSKFHERGIGMEFTEAGTPSAATLSDRDRLGPFLLGVAKFIAGAVVGSVKPVKPTAELQGQPDDPLKKQLEELQNLKTEIRTLAKTLRNVANAPLADTPDDLKTRQAKIETLRQQISVLSEMYASAAVSLEKVTNVEQVMLPVWKQSPFHKDNEAKTATTEKKNDPVTGPTKWTWTWKPELKLNSNAHLVVTLEAICQGPPKPPAVDDPHMAVYYRVPLEVRADATIQADGDPLPLFTNQRFVIGHLGGTAAIGVKSKLMENEELDIEYHPATAGLKKVGQKKGGGAVDTAMSAATALLEGASTQKEETSGTSILKADNEYRRARLEEIKNEAEREAILQETK